MRDQTVGISDIQIYLPTPKMDLDTLVDRRVREVPKLERHLARARRATGQRAIRFTSVWEDTSTLAASAAFKLIQENPEIDVSTLRYLTVGTETGIDHSKPVSAHVEGMLQSAGVDIPESLSSFQVQHACAAGTLALLSVSALLRASGRQHESGIVMCSDIARYEPYTTAEVTQGAGSVALLVESGPKLLELDLSSQGYCSRDTDDFFRPLGSKTAQVKGTCSMQCYRETLDSAFVDHCNQIGKTPAEVLEETDLFALHTPFRNLPESAMIGLLAKHLALDSDQAMDFLESRGLYDGIDAVADVGNIYTGAMYLALAFQLYNQHKRLGNDIVGKRVLLCSYGSGNTMTVISGRIAEGAPKVIERWNLEALVESGREASFKEYQQWIDGPYAPTGLNFTTDRPDAAPVFTLTRIREDGYREYGFHGEVAGQQANQNRAENVDQYVAEPVVLYQTA